MPSSPVSFKSVCNPHLEPCRAVLKPFLKDVRSTTNMTMLLSFLMFSLGPFLSLSALFVSSYTTTPSNDLGNRPIALRVY